LRGEDGKKQTHNSGEKCEEEAFREHLLKDAEARCTESEAHGKFAAAASGAREKKIGDVGASDEQNEADGADQCEQGRANVAGELLAKRNGEGAKLGVLLGVLLFELFGDDGKVGVGGGEGDARFEAGDDVKVVAAVIG